MKRDRLYFSFLCLCCFLFCALDVQAQQDYWKGQVKDAVSGEPMIGVSVRVKGKYSINSPFHSKNVMLLL
ncbi:hypothetical protein [Bacteroides ovatus]|uniref:hypothetical protein n=1 Tax=Bacteroides ovatus TaxID=28116 RepID=UPI00189ECF7D|nr:hypothetical protein [Bacteroides ovatus]MDC2659013.1 hypothetical protein [Bacteroides ovatus]